MSTRTRWIVTVATAGIIGMLAGSLAASGAASTGERAVALGPKVTYSGCLLGGKILSVRSKDVAPERCDDFTNAAGATAKYMTWNATGPEGPQGPTGPQGPAGPPGPPSQPSFRQFYITLDPADGATEEQVVLFQGTLTLTARCHRNQDFGSGPEDLVELVVTNSEDGWYDNNDNLYPAAGEYYIGDEFEDTGVTRVDNDIDEGFAVAPSGDLIGIDGESTVYGLNVFGHRCLVAGQAWTMRGNP